MKLNISDVMAKAAFDPNDPLTAKELLLLWGYTRVLEDCVQAAAGENMIRMLRSSINEAAPE